MHQIKMGTRKNILDLDYQKYIQYYNTAIIILFTYIIGLGISILTKQISMSNIEQFIAIFVISSIVVSFIKIKLNKFNTKLEIIKKEIKNLK